MRNFKIQIVILTLILFIIPTEETKAGNPMVPAYTPFITLESIIFFTELTSNAEFIIFNESELSRLMKMDASLELESWMTETNWSKGIEFINESDLKLESWMTNYRWNQSKEEFNESELVMEYWMKEPVNWNKRFTN
ncbi:MAG: hypothetical protein ACP5E3_11050 [Bacteroidales bacterium]